jgi:hypothetical protein
MTIGLYYNKSDERKLNKDLDTIATYNGYLKNECSIQNPTVFIEGAFNIGNNINANYMFLPDYRRYYYITEITQVRANLVKISGRVDVLMSFKDEIQNSIGIVRKQEHNYNLFLDDGSLKVYQDKLIICKEFPNGFPRENDRFILVTAGG